MPCRGIEMGGCCVGSMPAPESGPAAAVEPPYRALKLLCFEVNSRGRDCMRASMDGSPWKRLAAASRREKKMSHITVGQLTPDLVMALKMWSTYCRRFSCNGRQGAS